MDPYVLVEELIEREDGLALGIRSVACNAPAGSKRIDVHSQVSPEGDVHDPINPGAVCKLANACGNILGGIGDNVMGTGRPREGFFLG